MQLRTFTTLIAISMIGCATTALPDSPVPVAIWKESDVGQANRLADSLDLAFSNSGHFVVMRGEQVSAFQIVIRDEFADVGPNRVRIQVDFMRDYPAKERRIGSSVTNCEKKDFSRCAEVVLNVARRVILPKANRRLRR